MVNLILIWAVLTLFQIYYATNEIIVVFVLLDVAPMVGNVVNPLGETPLNTAATTLQNLVKNSKLAISLDATIFPNVSR